MNVYSRLSLDDAFDYPTLKTALLKRFDLTADGFRKRFKTGRPEQGETFIQYISRARSNLARWLELGTAERTFEGIVDFLLRDQLLSTCGHELLVFLKEKAFVRSSIWQFRQTISPKPEEERST